MGMTQNHGAPTGDVINVPLMVGIEQISALRFFDKNGRSTHRFKSTHGGIHSPRDDLFCGGKQCATALVCIHFFVGI